ncbi:MAG: hypothetical protein V4615_06690 [Bacteroidota bacterium]
MLDRILNPAPTIYKWDRFWVGFVPGLLGPVVCILFFYFLKYTNNSFTEYLFMVRSPVVLSPILSLGVIVNLFIFFPFIWSNHYNAARGVIGATFIYAIPIVVTKFMV